MHKGIWEIDWMSVKSNRVGFLVMVVVVCTVGFLGGASEKTTYMVPMRDGVKLATDVWLPEGDGPWPVVLIRTPYDRDLWRMGDPDIIPRFVSGGYVLVSQDIRGTGDSEGLYDPSKMNTCGWGELQDGYDTLMWVAEHEWCNGKIGTFGHAQHLMAGSHPPHLVCQHITNDLSDSTNGFSRGGIPLMRTKMMDWEPNITEDRERGDANARVANMSYAGFHVGGWYDPYSQGTIDGFVARQYHGGPGSAGNQKLVMGPWGHADSFNIREQGDLTYPENSLYASFWADCMAFFDYWLKCIDNGFTELPTVRYYVMGDVFDPSAPGNEWREADDWPVPYTNLSYYLSEDGLVQQSGSDSAYTYSYDPTDPVPSEYANIVPLALEQSLIEDREDVLVYSTQPLPVPVEITGRIYLQLYASSSCPDTDFIAKVTDVYPDGRSMIVAEGGIRARKRSMGEEELLEPGKIYELWIDLWSTSIVFNKGHRIRVMVTSSNYPRFGINPNTGRPLGTDTETRIADNTIHMGTTYPSRILLPLTGPDSDGDSTPDILDPAPYDARPHSKEDIAALIQDTDQLIASTEDQNLQGVLEEASRKAKEELEEGDLLGPGQFILLVQDVLSYSIPEISLPEAQEIVDRAMDLAMECAEEGKYGDMAQFMQTGWKLGDVREICEGKSLLVEHLQEAEELMNTDPTGTIGIADWCRQVLDLADEIQCYEARWQDMEKNVSERDLMILESYFSNAKKEFSERDDEGCESRLAAFKQKLGQLGFSQLSRECIIPEPILNLSILTALCLHWIISGSGRLGRLHESS